MAANFGTTTADTPLQLVSSTAEAVYSTYIDALPYADDPITDAEREMVQRMIDEELKVLKREEKAREGVRDGREKLGNKAAYKESEASEGRYGNEDRVARGRAAIGPPPSPPAPSSASAIDRARYQELRDVDAAKVALEYEMGRHLEAQLRLKYGPLSYRLSNEVRASVLQGIEESARGVAGDVGMINRERKRRCGGVKEELVRLADSHAGLVRKNRRLEEAVE